MMVDFILSFGSLAGGMLIQHHYGQRAVCALQALSPKEA